MSGTGDFWEDSQAFLGVPDTDVRDLLAQLDGSTPAAVELLTGASRGAAVTTPDPIVVSAETFDRLAAELQEPGQVNEALVAALKKRRRLILQDQCPKCGGHVRRWYADADGDGDVDPRAQCDDCEWGY